MGYNLQACVPLVNFCFFAVFIRNGCGEKTELQPITTDVLVSILTEIMATNGEVRLSLPDFSQI